MTLYDNTLLRWLTAFIATLVTLGLLHLLSRVVVRRLAFAVNRVTNLVSTLSQQTRFSVLLVIAVFSGMQFLTLPPVMVRWAGTIVIIALLLQIGLWGDTLISFWLTRYQRQYLEEDAGRVTTVKAASFVIRLILFVIILLLALDNIPGVEITTLIASLGVTGIAVALAVQSILADLFASLSLAFDKPFVIGDLIIVGEHIGKVEQIGLKTTRLRSLSGEQLIFSNSDLLNSRIRNFKRMEERRIAFDLGVTYQTPAESLRLIPTLLREVIEAQPNARFDRCHFKAYGSYALNFETVYYVTSPDYLIYMDAQQEINLAIFERFQEAGVKFAYPTQLVQLAGATA